MFLDHSLRSFLTEVLLCNPEKANLDECKALINLSIAGNLGLH